jgi:hypothetical protein
MASTTWKYFFGLEDPVSYHIVKKLGDAGKFFMWPPSGFGQFCTSESEARAQFQIEITRDPSGHWDLIKYPAVTSKYRWSILGITGEPTVVKSYSPPDSE